MAIWSAVTSRRKHGSIQPTANSYIFLDYNIYCDTVSYNVPLLLAPNLEATNRLKWSVIFESQNVKYIPGISQVGPYNNKSLPISDATSPPSQDGSFCATSCKHRPLNTSHTSSPLSANPHLSASHISIFQPPISNRLYFPYYPFHSPWYTSKDRVTSPSPALRGLWQIYCTSLLLPTTYATSSPS